MARGYNWLAPRAPQALRRQAAQDVRAQTIPLARELTRQINAAAAAGVANISGVSGQLAQVLGQQQGAERDIYQRAQDSQGALDTQQSQALGTAGGGIGADLRARLASAGAPSGLADSLASATQGAAGAGFARGSAQQGQLISNQAGAESYASKLPGLARLAGLQDVNAREAKAQSDISTQLGALNAKVPGMVSSELAALQQREYEKAVARQGFGINTAKINSANQRATQTNATRLTVAQIQSRDRNRAISAANTRSGMNLSERARHNGVTERQQAKRDQQNYKVRNRSITAANKRAAAARKAKKSGGVNTGLGK